MANKEWNEKKKKWIDSNDPSKLSLPTIMALTANKKVDDKKHMFGIQVISWNRIIYIVIRGQNYEQPTVYIPAYCLANLVRINKENHISLSW